MVFNTIIVYVPSVVIQINLFYMVGVQGTSSIPTYRGMLRGTVPVLQFPSSVIRSSRPD